MTKKAISYLLMPAIRLPRHPRPHKGWNPVRRESRIYRAGNVPGSVRRDAQYRIGKDMFDENY